MLLDHLDEQLRNCMVAIIGGEVANTQAAMAAAFVQERGTRHLRFLLAFCREGGACFALQLRVIAEPQEEKRRDALARVLLHQCDGARLFGRKPVPMAAGEHGIA